MAVMGDAAFITFAFPGLSGFRCAFTTRLAGNLSLAGTEGTEREAVAASRRTLRAALGIDSWSETKQVHGDALWFDPKTAAADAVPTREADGLATRKRRHVLAVKTADCQPILLAHPAGYVAAVHAGWRGNVLRFPETAVARFCMHYGLDPADVRAVRGPSLGHAEFVNFDREWPAAFAPWYDRDTRCMDLWSLTRRQLGEAGVLSRNMYGLDLCTLSLGETFFSYRRKDSGRQMGLVWME